MSSSPSGLAILLGAGPVGGAGIARVLADPSQGNLAVALLSRSGDSSLASSISQSSNGGQLKAFKADTSSTESLRSAFAEIKTWAESIGKSGSAAAGAGSAGGQAGLTEAAGQGGLKLKLAVWNIKHSHKTPFLEEDVAKFGDSLQTYVTGAMVFSQLVVKWLLEEQDATKMVGTAGTGESGKLEKKGTLIFTGTLGSLRTNSGYGAYGAGRSGVRMLAQSLAREFSEKGVHVVHAIANGGITDNARVEGKDGEVKSADDGTAKDEGNKDRVAVLAGKKMMAESVGRLYLGLMRQDCDLWVHELDMRPAAEKF